MEMQTNKFGQNQLNANSVASVCISFEIPDRIWQLIAPLLRQLGLDKLNEKVEKRKCQRLLVVFAFFSFVFHKHNPNSQKQKEHFSKQIKLCFSECND